MESGDKVARVGRFEIYPTPCERVDDVLLDQLRAVRVCVAGVSFEALGGLPGGWWCVILGRDRMPSLFLRREDVLDRQTENVGNLERE